MSLFPECNGLNKNHRDDPGIWSTTPEFGSKRTPHLRSTVPNVQRHKAYFAASWVDEQENVCVFITAGPITKLFAGGGGGEWTTCAMIDDEPRPVWMSPLILGCVLEIKSEISKFWSRKRAKKNQGKQRNQNFTKESEKIVIRKLGYRKDSYSKTCVQRKILVFPKKCDFGFRSRYQLVISTFQRQKWS